MKIKEIQYHEVKWQNLATIIYDDWSLTTIPRKDMFNFDWVRAFLKSIESFKDWYDVASEERDKKYWQKESDNKLSYELDRYFIEAMAKRMQQNKGKYPPYNRKKPMDIESLKQALLRHTIEVMKGNYDDNEELDHNWLWHIMWIACNAMFIYYQLKQWHTTKM